MKHSPSTPGVHPSAGASEQFRHSGASAQGAEPPAVAPALVSAAVEVLESTVYAEKLARQGFADVADVLRQHATRTARRALAEVAR